MQITALLPTLVVIVTHATVNAYPMIPPWSNYINFTNWSHQPQRQITPKVFIVSMFDWEEQVWFDKPEFDILGRNITVPGLSPIYPDVHCTLNGEICQVVTGEAEINAAVTMTALLASPLFDLRSTYFFIAGIAGINPEVTTIGSVTFARYAVQVALQYEIDARELTNGTPTGYIPQGSQQPNQYPGTIYGTELFELNTNLRSKAVQLATQAVLEDNDLCQAYRAQYGNANSTWSADYSTPPIQPYTAALKGPSVVECDVATSDTYYSGRLLGEAFSNYTRLLTNGAGLYCSTAQEDNATLEVLLRGAKIGIVDFSRIILMRTASDFDRQYPGQTAAGNLFADPGSFPVAIENIYLAGVKVVMGIVDEWDATFKAGVKADNYIGDIWGTLGGTPDFGPAARR